MILRFVVAVLATILCGLVASKQAECLPAQQQPGAPTVRQFDSHADFLQQLQTLARLTADPCDPPLDPEPPESWRSWEIEGRLFADAENIVADRLDATAADPGDPRDRVTALLQELQDESARTNAKWPEDSRFQFQVLDLTSALVVKVGIRAHQTFWVFGAVDDDSHSNNRHWHGAGGDFGNHEYGGHLVSLYPLARAPSGNARFLAKLIHSGCAGSIGVSYDAREWDPRNGGSLEQIIEQEGAFGLDDRVPGFEQIGKLQTDGPLITLPYCWFSAIDTWDNPSLCAVDTYDLSRNDVRFRSRVVNRPDLLPIAKAIEYARRREYGPVLSYCASAEIARKLVHELPPWIFAGDLQVTHIGRAKERVLVGDPPAYRFEVAERSGRWVVVAFSSD